MKQELTDFLFSVFVDELQGLKGLGEGDVAGRLSSSVSWRISNLRRFLRGAVLGSRIFLGSASFLLFRKEIGVT